MTLTQLFTNIANAIRAKKGTSEAIKAEDFANEIDGIPTGITPIGEIEITENGQVDVSQYASANVNIPIQKYYTGSGSPSSDLGNDGDLYLEI